jgi:short-subunit dehydrogenase
MSDSKKLALITGASAGIGLALAEVHAASGGDLVLVARRKEKLLDHKKRLEQKHGISVTVIAKDLSASDGPLQVYSTVKELGLQLDYLINNAGFSRQGYFHEIDWKKQESMIMLNARAMVELCYLFLPDMLERKSGKILNVASSAALAPGGPLQTMYYATKAFIVSFSQGLAGETEDKGVSVTALCPGATHTEFEKVSGLDKTPLLSREKAFPAELVAKEGYEAMLKGELVKLTALTPVNKFLLKNMNLFPARRILQQIRQRQERIK